MDSIVELMRFKHFQEAMEYSKRISNKHNNEIYLRLISDAWVVLANPKILYQERYEEDELPQEDDEDFLDEYYESSSDDGLSEDEVRAIGNYYSTPLTETEELLDELGDDSEDWERSEEDGWFYDD